jgi:hypothetical protein
MQTQKQMFYKASRKNAETYQFIDWLAKQDNAPIKKELDFLKRKNKSWEKYPDSLVKN